MDEIEVGTEVMFQKHGTNIFTEIVDRMFVDEFDEYVYKHQETDVYHGRKRYTKETELTL